MQVLGNYYYYQSGDKYSYGTETYSYQPIYSTTGAYEYKYEEITNAVKTNYINGKWIISNFKITNIKIGHALDWQKENSLPSY